MAKLRCDICLRKDGWKDLCIQKCSSCGVCVHGQCYGLESINTKDPSWMCWACQAVNKEVEGWTLQGKKLKKLQVTERPKECVLCSVSTGVHAMHALYHTHGKAGRQIILPASRSVPQRLGWVHTICALGVCSHRGTRGAVYGCDKDGDYESYDSVHHFVMIGFKRLEEDRDYIDVVEEHRKLVCTICGHKEKTAGRNLRVPLQCCAGDEDEYQAFKSYHENDACTQAMHVGCAMWGSEGNPPRHRRMWFFPGCTNSEEDLEDPVLEIFCELHASQMGASSTGLRVSHEAEIDEGTTFLKLTPAQPEPLELPAYDNASALGAQSDSTTSTREDKTNKSTAKSKKRIVERHKGSTPAQPETQEFPAYTMANVLASQEDSTSSTTEHKPSNLSQKSKTLVVEPDEESVCAQPESLKLPASAKAKALAAQNESTSSKMERKASKLPKKSKNLTVLPDEGATSAQPEALVLPTPAYAAANALAAQNDLSLSSKTEGKPTEFPAKSEKLVAPPYDGATVAADSADHAPLQRKRRRSISEHKEEGENNSATNNDQHPTDDSGDGGFWLDDCAYGHVRSTVQETARPVGDDPWEHLWKTGAAPFKIEVIASAERRDIDGLMKSLRSRKYFGSTL